MDIEQKQSEITCPIQIDDWTPFSVIVECNLELNLSCVSWLQWLQGGGSSALIGPQETSTASNIDMKRNQSLRKNFQSTLYCCWGVLAISTEIRKSNQYFGHICQEVQLIEAHTKAVGTFDKCHRILSQCCICYDYTFLQPTSRY